ncbi:hypothetical protein B0H14DRAFT_2564703 [Mycena olivaceomarginata]|nr:hypothetical protein B0H14DRAFT_2564703 [Mycena olivaceomarginata]
MYQHYSVSSEQCGPYQGHIPRFAKLLHDPKWVKRIKLLQIDEAHFITTTERKGRKQRSDQHFRTSASACVFISLPTTPCHADPHDTSLKAYPGDMHAAGTCSVFPAVYKHRGQCDAWSETSDGDGAATSNSHGYPIQTMYKFLVQTYTYLLPPGTAP